MVEAGSNGITGIYLRVKEFLLFLFIDIGENYFMEDYFTGIAIDMAELLPAVDRLTIAFFAIIFFYLGE